MKSERVIARALILIVASIILGISYNRMHPFGIEMNAKAGVSKPGLVRPHQPEPGSEPGNDVYQHQLNRVSVEPARNGVGAGQASSGGRFRNVARVSSAPAPMVSPAASPAIREVSWSGISADVASGTVILLDARSRAAHAAGHIPGAVLLPYTELGKEISRFKEHYSVDTRLVVYCADSGCHVSHILARELSQKHGYQNVAFMPGGYLEWRKEQAKPSANTPDAR